MRNFERPPTWHGLRRACWRLRADTDATVAIEFAILSPVFFALLFGIIAFGIQYATRIALTYAASEGGRAAVTALDDATRQQVVNAVILRTLASLSPLVNPDNAHPVVSPPAAVPGINGKQIDITITYTDNRFAILPFVPQLNTLAPIRVRYFIVDPSG